MLTEEYYEFHYTLLDAVYTRMMEIELKADTANVNGGLKKDAFFKYLVAILRCVEGQRQAHVYDQDSLFRLFLKRGKVKLSSLGEYFCIM